MKKRSASIKNSLFNLIASMLLLPHGMIGATPDHSVQTTGVTQLRHGQPGDPTTTRWLSHEYLLSLRGTPTSTLAPYAQYIPDTFEEASFTLRKSCKQTLPVALPPQPIESKQPTKLHEAALLALTHADLITVGTVVEYQEGYILEGPSIFASPLARFRVDEIRSDSTGTVQEGSLILITGFLPSESYSCEHFYEPPIKAPIGEQILLFSSDGGTDPVSYNVWNWAEKTPSGSVARSGPLRGARLGEYEF